MPSVSDCFALNNLRNIFPGSAHQFTTTQQNSTHNTFAATCVLTLNAHKHIRAPQRWGSKLANMLRSFGSHRKTPANPPPPVPPLSSLQHAATRTLYRTCNINLSLTYTQKNTHARTHAKKNNKQTNNFTCTCHYCVQQLCN